jgi:parallel beta-helix repeat protein
MIPRYVLAALAVIVLALALAAPAQARWLSGDLTPAHITVPRLLPQDGGGYRACQDGITFQFADGESLGDHHPHPRPAGSPDSRTYQLVVRSNGPTPPEGEIVLDQPLTVPYHQIDILGDARGTPLALEHREYSGTFTVPWSVAPDTSVTLVVHLGTQFIDDSTFIVQNCNLPVQPPGCGQVITQDTTLQADLVNCIDGVVIGASGVTLDLNGHTIDGVGGGIGVDNSAGHAGVTIKNGTIQEFEMGVELTGAQGNRIRNLTLSNNEDGVVLFSSVGNRVQENTGGVVLGNSDGNQIKKNTGTVELILSHDNRVEDNTTIGIALVASDRNRVAANTASGGSRTGIDLSEGASNNRIEGNTVSGNGGDGINVGGNGNRVGANNVSGNFEGIRVGGNGNRVDGNTASMNGSAGISVSLGSDNRLIRNSTLNNTVGIEVAYAFGRPSSTRIEWNLATGNTEDGIRVSSDRSGTSLRYNIANRNLDDGIDVASPSTTLTKNTANDNVDLGIEAVSGVTDGGGNLARGNGNALQCTGVVCS